MGDQEKRYQGPQCTTTSTSANTLKAGLIGADRPIMSETHLSIAELNEVISKVQTTIGDLSAKLSPVCRSIPENCEKKKEQCYNTQIAKLVNDEKIRIEGILEALQTLYRIIEL